jgi:hypothetical protein
MNLFLSERRHAIAQHRVEASHAHEKKRQAYLWLSLLPFSSTLLKRRGKVANK